MKQWVNKLLEQLEWSSAPNKEKPPVVDLNEDRATLLYILDAYSKHLMDVEKYPVRKVREYIDSYTKALIQPESPETSKTLFNVRQFFSSYRIAEYTYLQNTFEDFKRIIWDFADQLTEDIQQEQNQNRTVTGSLEQLREAVESNSIEDLRAKSREFINLYMQTQTKKDDLRVKRLASVKKNLNSVKKQLMQANHSMRVDHLTQAYNRKSFDEQMRNHIRLYEISKNPVTLIMMDIDFFKKINDNYGHDIGDFVLKECVRVLKDVFHREDDVVARLGGEEFGVLLPDFNIENALVKVEEAMGRIRKEVFVHGSNEIRFTVSMGIAGLQSGETFDQWIKRADVALYESKNTGRNKYTVSGAVKLAKVS